MAVKKQKKENPLGLALFVVIMLIIAVGLLFIFREPDDNSGSGNAGDNNITRAKAYFTYPTDYEEYVLKYADEFDIDPCYIFAVIRAESSFVEDAESEVGARGLMQIMPDAFDWIQYRLGEDDLTFDDMYKAEYNIRYGTYMLSYLYEDFGSFELASAAYHQGMNAVQSWIDDGTIDPEHFNINDGLDDMPSAVTRDYIYKIMKAYDKYKENTQLKEDIEKWKKQ